MTPETDKFANFPKGESLTASDWDVMFCAVLARLSAAIAPLDLKPPQWTALSECLESLQWLRQSALLNWSGADPATSITSAAWLPGTAPAAQTGDGSAGGEAP